MHKYKHPTARNPDHVILLCLGESKREYADILATQHDGRWPTTAEIWTVNAGIRVWRHDLAFVLDDLEQEAHKWPAYGHALASHDRPIITSTPYGAFPAARGYPFEAVCEALNLQGMDRYFYNSVPLILAYALFIGVKRMALFGVDYYHPNTPGREADVGNAHYWLGYCRAKGMIFELASDTTLMDARHHGRPMYGWRHDPRLTIDRHKARQAAESIEDEAPNRVLSGEAQAFVDATMKKREAPIRAALVGAADLDSRRPDSQGGEWPRA